MSFDKGLGIKLTTNTQMLSPPLRSIARSSPNLHDFFDEEMSLSEPSSFPISLHSGKKRDRSHMAEAMRSYESDTNLSRGMSIPSPPLSPKVKQRDIAAAGSLNFQEISGILLHPIQDEWRVSKAVSRERRLPAGNSIVVRSVWDPQMTVQRYHSEITDFLSRYGIFHGLHSEPGRSLSSSGTSAGTVATSNVPVSARITRRQLRGSDGDLDYELSSGHFSSGSSSDNLLLPRIRRYNNVRKVSFSSPYSNVRVFQGSKGAGFGSSGVVSQMRRESFPSLGLAAMSSPRTVAQYQRGQPSQQQTQAQSQSQMWAQAQAQKQAQHRHRATVKRVKRVRTMPGSDGTSATRARHHSAPVLASAAAIQSVPRYIPGVSWQRLPDYTPPMSNIPLDNTRALKVEWKGPPMDLTNDPLRSMLHPAELVLAQILRLPCDLYLDSKRRLFLEKVYKYKKGLPFRRTDAQKACRIDVNKASRLYAAYEKVGWLDDSNFEKYLE